MSWSGTEFLQTRQRLDRYETLVDSLSDVLKIDRYGD